MQQSTWLFQSVSKKNTKQTSSTDQNLSTFIILIYTCFLLLRYTPHLRACLHMPTSELGFLLWNTGLPITSQSYPVFITLYYDCLVYRHILSPDDQDILQKDLTSLEQWTWGMRFNPAKCISISSVSVVHGLIRTSCTHCVVRSFRKKMRLNTWEYSSATPWTGAVT